MSDGMRRELAYLSSHATNRYFIPNWGYLIQKYVIFPKTAQFPHPQKMQKRGIPSKEITPPCVCCQ